MTHSKARAFFSSQLLIRFQQATTGHVMINDQANMIHIMKEMMICNIIMQL